MTVSNNLQSTSEPAYVINGKLMNRLTKSSGLHKSLNDCCYSISNLALIVACVLGLVFAAKFLYDDPLYEYGEHLLTLRFYRQIVYIIVILPLVLLVPLFNAISALFLSVGSSKSELGPALLVVKLIYQILIGLLVFVGLVFIAPTIRFGTVADQLSYELRRHMKRRYDNDFSFEFLDRIQEEYKCCDELWYRANLFDKLPLSCFEPDGTYSNIYERNCADVIATMVSNRSMMIAASLATILVALATLIGIDVVEYVNSSSSQQQYDVGSHEASLANTSETTSHLQQSRAPHNDGRHSDEDDDLVNELTNRLKMRERERETPLLPKTINHHHHHQVPQHGGTTPDSALGFQPDSSETLGDDDSARLPTTPVLTRANYLYCRPQSPVFITQAESTSGLDGPRIARQQQQQPPPPPTGLTKGVLKKSTSFQRIDSDDDEPDQDHYHHHQQQQRHNDIKRDQQTRRSLLSVRFAD